MGNLEKLGIETTHSRDLSKNYFNVRYSRHLFVKIRYLRLQRN